MFLQEPWYRSLVHNAFRIVAGAAFFTHGGQKLFAWFGAETPRLDPVEYLIAGVLEFGGGLAIALGLFTRPVAFLVAGEMAVAFFWKHAMGQESLWWWNNRGEMVMLYCFAWLLLSGLGSGSFSVDAWLAKRRSTGGGGGAG